MISFRYHLVSIIAVFLALAVGIAVGTAALNGPVTRDLHNQVDSLKAQRADLSAQVKTLNGQVGDGGQFAATFGSQLVAGELKDVPVLVLGMPGVPATMAAGVTAQLTAAGAKLTGGLDFAHDYVDQADATKITTLVTNSGIHPLGLDLTATSDARVLAAETLAWVLLGKGQQTDLKTVLGGFANLHMFDSDAASVQPATTIVVVGSGTMKTDSYAGQAELALVNALQQDDATVVVAGDDASAAGGGLVALVRGGSAKSVVSTVDNADTAYGQVSTVLALSQARDSQVGQYGTAAGADALFPRPSS